MSASTQSSSLRNKVSDQGQNIEYIFKRFRYQDAEKQEMVEVLVDSMDEASGFNRASKKEKIKNAVGDLEDPPTSELADTYDTSAVLRIPGTF